MKAIVHRRYGPPDVLSVQDVPLPTIGDNDVLIRVKAVEVTKSDCELRGFNFPVKWHWPMLRLALGVTRPRRPVLGFYFAGTIERLGEAVTHLKVGEEVMGTAGFHFGAYAEYLRLPATAALAPKPQGLGFPEAAASLLGGLNALHFLSRARVRSGEQVLINGAGGSIGLAGIQIAKSLGAEVTAVDARHKEDLVRRAGADHFIDFQTDDFGTRTAAFDVMLDVVAGSDYGKCLNVLKPGGRYQTANPNLAKMLRAPWTTRFTDKTAQFAFAPETPDALAELATWLADGRIRPIIDRVVGPEGIVEAHQAVETEQRQGSIVLSPGGEGTV